ncbi:unnamed protein product [Paramecium octaurelia]|nr:unnamed protein product [Paramecium octaurelia]
MLLNALIRLCLFAQILLDYKEKLIHYLSCSSNKKLNNFI